MELDEIADNNGFILNSYFLPEEIVTHILSFLDARFLAYQCRYVCRAWRNIIEDKEIWKEKLLRSNTASLSKLSTDERKQLTLNYQSRWYLYFWILNDVPFDRNLLKNNCGQLRLQHWEVTKPTHSNTNFAGDANWDIESQPIFANTLPESDDFERNRSCFSTSYRKCVKHQIIDLRENNFPSKLLDEFQPSITISEWYASRYDCGCRYILKASLLDENKQVIMSMEPIEKVRDQWAGQEWNKVSHKIENYGIGVRYIVFEHEGKDTQFWAGNYGSKMAGGIVKISFPQVPRSVI